MLYNFVEQTKAVQLDTEKLSMIKKKVIFV